jgi:hypothetical protein
MLTAGDKDGDGEALITFSVDDATPEVFCERSEMTYSSCWRIFAWKEKCWFVTGGFGEEWNRRWDRYGFECSFDAAMLFTCAMYRTAKSLMLRLVS